jgi:hypothetical protein
MVRPIHTGYLDGGGVSHHTIGTEPRCPGCREFLALQPPPRRLWPTLGHALARFGMAIGWVCSRLVRRLQVPCPQGAREGRPHWWGGDYPENWFGARCTCCAGKWRGDREPRDAGLPPTNYFTKGPA